MKFKENQPPLEHAATRGEPLGSGIWETRLRPVLDRYCLKICLCLIGIACARIISTYNALSLTVDEPWHFACSLEYVAKHVYRFEKQHPPLSRMMQALGPYLVGVRPAGMSSLPRWLFSWQRIGLSDIIQVTKSSGFFRFLTASRNFSDAGPQRVRAPSPALHSPKLPGPPVGWGGS